MIQKRILLHLAFFFSLSTYGQDLKPVIVNEDGILGKEFINQFFEGGYEGYTEFFRQNLTYPESSYKNQVEGLMLLNFSINPVQKKIDIQFLTLLDKAIEKQIDKVLKLSLSKWRMEEDKDYTIYQPIVYSMLPYYPEAFVGDVPEIPTDLPLKFNQPFVLIKSNRITADISLKALKNQDVSESKKTLYQRGENAYRKFLEKGDKESAYLVLNQIIRYNPLNRDYLLARIKLEKDIKVNEYQVYDSYLLSDFVDKANNEYRRITKSEPNVVTAKYSSRDMIDSLSSLNAHGYIQSIRNNFRLSKATVQNQVEGLIIIQMKMSKDGQMNIKFMTKLDDDLEQSLTAYLTNYAQFWRFHGQPYEVYQVLSVGTSNYSYTNMMGEVEGFPLEFDPPFAPVVSRSVRMVSQTSTRIKITRQPGDNRTMEQIARDQIAKLERDENRRLSNMPPSPFDRSSTLEQYKKLIDRYKKADEKGNLKKTHKAITEVIRYNPFNLDFILKRYELEQSLGINEYQPYDVPWIVAIRKMKAKAQMKID